MPLYEYECSSCHRHTEKIQKFSDPEITVCPHCGGPLQRVLSAPAFALKGGGWYADGYGSAKPAASSSDAGSGSSSSEGSKSAPAAASTNPAPAAESKPASSAPAATSSSSDKS